MNPNNRGNCAKSLLEAHSSGKPPANPAFDTDEKILGFAERLNAKSAERRQKNREAREGSLLQIRDRRVD